MRALARKAAAVALGFVLTVVVLVPLLVLGAHSAADAYRDYQFKTRFFMACAKQEPLLIAGEPYLCAVAPLRQ